MAINVKEKLRADWAIAISGIAGPNGGTQEKPVGLVYISISGPNNQISILFRFELNTFLILVI